MRTSSGDSNTPTATLCTSIETAVFAPGLTMRGFKAHLASAAMQHRIDNGQGVQKNDARDNEKKITLYKEKRDMILSAIFASAVAGCLLIVFMFWQVAAQRLAWVKVELVFFWNCLRLLVL